jgi:hypothetical protein
VYRTILKTVVDAYKKIGVADYGYDFNFLDDLKTYIHRTFAIVKIGFSYLDSATPQNHSNRPTLPADIHPKD